VACAVIVKRKKFQQKINDSKKLTAKQRLAAYQEIKKKAYVGIGMVGEKGIDRINIYQATIQAMEEAIKNLPKMPQAVILDGKMKINLPITYQSVVAADRKSFSCACASIVAKVARDKLMEAYHEIYPAYGFSQHKGYPTKYHLEMLHKNGPSPIHRLSFRPLSGARHRFQGH
jgi:ribonuclease HII